MRQFKLIKKIQLTIVSAFLLMGSVYAQDPIGDIVESTGVGGIVRNNERYYGLCEGCGWITMDKNGKRIEEDEE